MCVGFFISWIFALLLFIPLGHTKRCGKCRAFFIIYHSGCPRFSPNPLPIDVVPLKRSNMRKHLGNNIEQLWLRKTERGEVLNYVVFAAFARKIFNIYLITTWTKARAPQKKHCELSLPQKGMQIIAISYLMKFFTCRRRQTEHLCIIIIELSGGNFNYENQIVQLWWERSCFSYC